MDSIRITYWHTFTADGDQLRFTVPGPGEVRVGGFRSPRIQVFDITRPCAVQLPRSCLEKEAGGYAVRVGAEGARTILAVSEEAFLNPESIAANRPSRWHESQRGEEVIIGTADLLPSLAPLIALREREGRSVAAIDVEDLYDEFNFGEKSPQALKDFLAHAAARWQDPPRFVLLVGDSSFDPRNYLGHGDRDLVPTRLVDTAVLETACDDWFADFDGDGPPEMAVGRLPVHTAEEAARVVAKIVRRDMAGAPPDPAVLLVNDRDGDGDFGFEAESAGLRELVPAGLRVMEVSRAASDDQVARSSVLEALREGPLLASYLGHGSVEVWAGNLLTSADAPSLAGTASPPFMVLMDCLNGFFHDLYTESLAEALLVEAGEGGAVGVWASSGLTEPPEQASLDREFLRLLFEEGNSLTLGEAARRAKAAITDRDIRRTWIFFGDPASRLR